MKIKLSELRQIVKSIIKETVEGNCSKPADWLLDYKIDGKAGKEVCSELRWDLNTYEFLAIHLKDQTVFLSISVESLEETVAQELAGLFKMAAPKLTNFKKYYFFSMNYASAEPGGDLNKLLNSLQRKIPFMSSINESFFRKNNYKKNRYL